LAIVITKGVVALCTTYYCQKSITLIKWRAVSPVVTATAIGAGLYFGLGLLGIREVAEAGALAPFGWLAVRWWKDMKAQAKAL
jgi:hypothetical protein